MLPFQKPDRQFDALLDDASRQNLPTAITLGMSEDDWTADALVDGVYSGEIAVLLTSGGNLLVQNFVVTMELTKTTAP